MTHSYFCCNSACPNSTNATLSLMTCGRCRLSWYCDGVCQKADWPRHKQECRQQAHEKAEKDMFTYIGARLGCDTQTHTYEQYMDFMKNESHRYPPRTTQEYIEDWLGGWYTPDRERKEMLRAMFQTNGLKWSLDAYKLYLEWTDDLKGNRYQKMAEFIRATKSLF
jgi:hypothetical protein